MSTEPLPSGRPDVVDKRSIARRLIDLALPIIGLNVLTVLALVVDTAMCARLPEAETVLAALGFATQLVFLLMVAMLGLSVGGVALVARAYGAGDLERVGRLVDQAVFVTVSLSMVIAVVGNVFAGPLIAVFGAEPAAVDTALLYLRPLLTGTVFYYLGILFTSLLRGVGNTRLPFLVALVSNGLNIVFNYSLILGNFGMPALGVRGAAYGTVASQAAGVLLMVALLRRGAVPGIRPSLRPVTPDLAIVKQIYRIGAPAALDMVVLNAAFLSLIGMLGRIDQATVAAHVVGLRIQSLAFVPGMSISQATGAMVGQALGAGDVAQARQVLRASVRLCTLVMTALAAAIISAADPIVSLFNLHPGDPITELTITWMRILGLGLPIVGTWIALVGLFQGSGATRTSLRINVFATLVIMIPLGYTLGFPLGFGAVGVWMSFPLSFCVKSAMGWLAYRKGDWAKTGMTPDDEPAT